MTKQEAREAFEAAVAKKVSAQEQMTTIKAMAVRAEQEYWAAQQEETRALEMYQKILEGH